MSEFSMLDEIEKYLLEIFENKQRFYEKVLKKSDQLEGGRKNIFSNKNVFKKDVRF